MANPKEIVAATKKSATELISERATELLATAELVNSKSLASLFAWLDDGAVELGKLVGDVKAIKSNILKSDAKSKVKADVYVVTTPLIKAKMKTSAFSSVVSLHTKRLRNIVAMCNTLNGVSPKQAKAIAKAAKAKAKKGGAK